MLIKILNAFMISRTKFICITNINFEFSNGDVLVAISGQADVRHSFTLVDTLYECIGFLLYFEANFRLHWE